MMHIRRSLVAAAVVLAGAGVPAQAATKPVTTAVVALIDTGVNPYNPAFRDRSALAYQHPSTYLRGFPRGAQALRLTLDRDYDEAIARDAAVWENVEPGELYWIPGTKIVGAISFGGGGTNCPRVPVPPANILNGSCVEHPILDDHGHGTMTASRATGTGTSLAPEARLVVVEGPSAKSVRWVADRGWIDVQSNSWLSLVPQPLEGAAGGDVTDAFAYASARTLTLAASGNGTGFVLGGAPTPTYALSTAPPGVVLVGGHDNGRVTPWAGIPAHVVADAYAGMTAISTSREIRPDPVACCTSAASPYAAGAAAAVLLAARRAVRDTSLGVHGTVVARGRKVGAGPLADGVLTLEEWRRVLFHTAEARPGEGKHDGLVHWAGDPRPPDFTQFGPGANPYCQGCLTAPVSWGSVSPGLDLFPYVGYGALNERSVTLAVSVLRGAVPEPARAAEDADYQRDQQLRYTLRQ